MVANQVVMDLMDGVADWVADEVVVDQVDQAAAWKILGALVRLDSMLKGILGDPVGNREELLLQESWEDQQNQVLGFLRAGSLGKLVLKGLSKTVGGIPGIFKYLEDNELLPLVYSDPTQAAT
eukprot:gene18568-22167_t